MKFTAQNNSPLLEILQSMAPDSSKNTLRSWLQAGRVSVDGRPQIRANAPISPGQEIAIGPKVSFVRGQLRVLHEDEDIVVLEKPPGLLSVATDSENRATVHAFLKKRFHNRRVYPVHRLDRETSGVMIFAYNEKARDNLKTQFEKQLVDKTYFAIVEGEMPKDKNSWESYLEEDDFYYVRSTNDSEHGKKAVTKYEVIQAHRNRTLLRLTPKTGRKNQLRVHCSEAGHPICGDKKYGAKTNPIKRLCLHAFQIGFTHPSKDRKMVFKSPLPDNFYSLFETEDLKI